MIKEDSAIARDLSLLVLRIGFGATMLFSHGLGKLQAFPSLKETFPDPIGLGSTIALSLAIFAEVFCSAAVVLGVKTRFASVPLLITMLVAALVIHADDPFQKKEMALLYAVAFVVLTLMGGGRLSLDAKLKK